VNMFKEYVTGQAFALTLSKRMCEAMQYLMVEALWAGRGFRVVGTIPHSSTINSLIERGLVERIDRNVCLTGPGLAMYEVLVWSDLVMSAHMLTEIQKPSAA
jgi:hypothetical protein